jgi:hypothetical protein
MFLSKKFIQALRATQKPYHRIAWESGIKPNQLYKLTSGIDRPEKNDRRIIALCNYLGLPLNEALENGRSKSK